MVHGTFFMIQLGLVYILQGVPKVIVQSSGLLFGPGNPIRKISSEEYITFSEFGIYFFE